MQHSRRSLLGLGVLVLAASAASQWWAGHRQQDIGAEVAALARPGDIRMLASASCGICITARRWFGAHGVAFSECVIEHDPACRQDFEALQAPGTPVLVVRGQPQLGFSPERLRSALQPRG